MGREILSFERWDFLCKDKKLKINMRYVIIVKDSNQL